MSLFSFSLQGQANKQQCMSHTSCASVSAH